MFTKTERITVKQFARVPALLNFPPIERPLSSISEVSSFQGVGGGIDLAEGCFITKATKYTHQLTHWINVVRDKSHDADADAIVSTFISIFKFSHI
jgi:hypothetical protein